MATDFAVLHYQHMASQAAALRAMQATFDNRAEPEQDDIALTEDEARELAVNQVLATPALLANWLACECAANESPVEVDAMTAYAVLEASVPTLLAVLLAGDDRHASRALNRLRELATEQNAEVIDQRAQRLLQVDQLELPLCAA
jgi:hypothetical protein